MSNKDEFDIDVDENADEGFDEVSLDEETTEAEQQPAKKKSGAGLVSVIAILAVLGGGTFAAVKFLGVQLPFDIPGVTPPAQVAQQPANTAPASEITASADLPQDSLPPQPEVPAADDVSFGDSVSGDVAATDGAVPADAGSSLPNLGISGDTGQDLDINPPWDGGAADTAADAASAGATTDAGNIVDPFAMAGTQQDVTDAVNNAAAPATSPAAEVVDPFAVAGTAAETTTPAVDMAAEPAASTESQATASGTKAADPKQAARTAELEKKVAELEKSLAAADKALKKANDDLAASQKQLTEKTDALAKAKADAKAETKAAAAVKREDSVKPEPVKTEAKPAAVKKAAAPAVRKAWVLRSAKPGMAWVSEKGSNEMRTIAVGDTLSGIGKVTAITTDAQGRWVVNGTRGTINQ